MEEDDSIRLPRQDANISGLSARSFFPDSVLASPLFTPYGRAYVEARSRPSIRSKSPRKGLHKKVHFSPEFNITQRSPAKRRGLRETLLSKSTKLSSSNNVVDASPVADNSLSDLLAGGAEPEVSRLVHGHTSDLDGSFERFAGVSLGTRGGKGWQRNALLSPRKEGWGSRTNATDHHPSVGPEVAAVSDEEWLAFLEEEEARSNHLLVGRGERTNPLPTDKGWTDSQAPSGRRAHGGNGDVKKPALDAQPRRVLNDRTNTPVLPVATALPTSSTPMGKGKADEPADDMFSRKQRDSFFASKRGIDLSAHTKRKMEEKELHAEPVGRLKETGAGAQSSKTSQEKTRVVNNQAHLDPSQREISKVVNTGLPVRSTSRMTIAQSSSKALASSQQASPKQASRDADSHFDSKAVNSRAEQPTVTRLGSGSHRAGVKPMTSAAVERPASTKAKTADQRMVDGVPRKTPGEEVRKPSRESVLQATVEQPRAERANRLLAPRAGTDAGMDKEPYTAMRGASARKGGHLDGAPVPSSSHSEHSIKTSSIPTPHVKERLQLDDPRKQFGRAHPKPPHNSSARLDPRQQQQEHEADVESQQAQASSLPLPPQENGIRSQPRPRRDSNARFEERRLRSPVRRVHFADDPSPPKPESAAPQASAQPYLREDRDAPALIQSHTSSPPLLASTPLERPGPAPQPEGKNGDDQGGIGRVRDLEEELLRQIFGSKRNQSDAEEENGRNEGSAEGERNIGRREQDKTTRGDGIGGDDDSGDLHGHRQDEGALSPAAEGRDLHPSSALDAPTMPASRPKLFRHPPKETDRERAHPANKPTARAEGNAPPRKPQPRSAPQPPQPVSQRPKSRRDPPDGDGSRPDQKRAKLAVETRSRPGGGQVQREQSAPKPRPRERAKDKEPAKASGKKVESDAKVTVATATKRETKAGSGSANEMAKVRSAGDETKTRPPSAKEKLKSHPLPARERSELQQPELRSAREEAEPKPSNAAGHAVPSQKASHNKALVEKRRQLPNFAYIPEPAPAVPVQVPGPSTSSAIFDSPSRPKKRPRGEEEQPTAVPFHVPASHSRPPTSRGHGSTSSRETEASRQIFIADKTHSPPRDARQAALETDVRRERQFSPLPKRARQAHAIVASPAAPVHAPAPALPVSFAAPHNLALDDPADTRHLRKRLANAPARSSDDPIEFPVRTETLTTDVGPQLKSTKSSGAEVTGGGGRDVKKRKVAPSLTEAGRRETMAALAGKGKTTAPAPKVTSRPRQPAAKPPAAPNKDEGNHKQSTSSRSQGHPASSTMVRPFRFASDVRVRKHSEMFAQRKAEWEARERKEREERLRPKPVPKYPDVKVEVLARKFSASASGKKEGEAGRGDGEGGEGRPRKRPRREPAADISFGLETNRRMKARRKFDEQVREKEIVRERLREIKRREEEARDAVLTKEARKHTVIRAHPVPEWIRERRAEMAEHDARDSRRRT